VAIGSAVGLVVYVGIDVSLFENLTGTAETLSVIPVFVLLALVLAGLVAVIDPFWAWGSGRNLTSGDGSAIPTIVAGLFLARQNPDSALAALLSAGGQARYLCPRDSHQVLAAYAVRDHCAGAGFRRCAGFCAGSTR
jgi:hypothetical protein